MRKLFGFFAIATLALAGQAHAVAGTFTGTLSVAIGTLPPFSAVGSGNVTLNGSGGLGHLDSVEIEGGTFATVVSVPVTDPAAFPIGGVKASLTNGQGNFALGGQMPVIGTSNVCLFGACNGPPLANVDVPFTVMGTRGVGIGGGPIIVGSLVNVTVTGNPWALGTTMIGTVTGPTGFAHGPASGGSSSAAQEGGVLQLVTPVVINTNIGASATLPAFGVLNLTFSVIPEPGTLVLLGSGAVGLAMLGRKRMGK